MDRRIDMKVIYSRERVDLESGDRYQNPSWFLDRVEGATRVIVHGDYPAIVDAYRKAGVPVTVDGLEGDAEPLEPALGAAQRALDPAIPADWRDLDWPELRSLASKVSEEPIKTKEDAVDAIEAELERRADA
jgi:hypothetical protein